MTNMMIKSGKKQHQNHHHHHHHHHNNHHRQHQNAANQQVVPLTGGSNGKPCAGTSESGDAVVAATAAEHGLEASRILEASKAVPPLLRGLPYSDPPGVTATAAAAEGPSGCKGARHGNGISSNDDDGLPRREPTVFPVGGNSPPPGPPPPLPPLQPQPPSLRRSRDFRHRRQTRRVPGRYRRDLLVDQGLLAKPEEEDLEEEAEDFDVEDVEIGAKAGRDAVKDEDLDSILSVAKCSISGQDTSSGTGSGPGRPGPFQQQQQQCWRRFDLSDRVHHGSPGTRSLTCQRPRKMGSGGGGGGGDDDASDDNAGCNLMVPMGSCGNVFPRVHDVDGDKKQQQQQSKGSSSLFQRQISGLSKIR